MNKEIFSQNLKRAKILGNKKLTSINGIDVTCIKKISIQNYNGRLTTLAPSSTKNNSHLKKSFVLEQFNQSKKKKSILTETIYDEKKLFKNKNKFKNNKGGKTENSNLKYKTHKIKGINIKKNNSNQKIKYNKIKITPKKNKLIENDSLSKISNLYLHKVLNNNTIDKYYHRENMRKLPDTSRKYETYSSHKKIKNDIIKFNEKLLKSQSYIRNINLLSIYKKNANNNLRYKKFNILNQNCINYDTSMDIKNLYYSKNYYQYTDIYQNLSFKLKAKNKEKSLFIKKNKEIMDINNSLTHINEESSKHLNLQNIKNKGAKIINFLDLIKMKKKKIEKIYMHNKSNKTNKSNKANNSIKGYCSEDNEKKKYVRYKASNNSIRNMDSVLKQKSFRSCDIPSKIKKNLEKLSIIPLIKLASKDKIINHKYSSIKNDKSHIFNGNKNKIKGLIQNSKNIEKESSYDFLESDNELNQELINEIKINNFDVNKPKEQNMKYTLYKEFKEENENENESSKPESHISKIIIGRIKSYKDIIEKDRINDKNTLNLNKDKNELITVPSDDSIESEKYIINILNFDDNENNSSLFSKDFKNNISNEKTINYKLKNTTTYPNYRYKEKINNNHLNNKKGEIINIEKNRENKSKDQLKKKNPKNFKKISKKTKINDGNILCKSNTKINRNKKMSEMTKTITSPLNKAKLTISKDSLAYNKTNLFSKFMDENNKKDENCSIF